VPVAGRNARQPKCAQLGISPERREENAVYVANWPWALKNDNHYVFTAASAAQKPVACLDGLQPARTQRAATTSDALALQV